MFSEVIVSRYSRLVLVLDSMICELKGIIDQVVKVGVRVISGVSRQIVLLVLFGWIIFLNSSLKMLVKVWKMFMFMYIGLWWMCIQLISLCFQIMQKVIEMIIGIVIIRIFRMIQISVLMLLRLSSYWCSGLIVFNSNLFMQLLLICEWYLVVWLCCGLI